MFLRPAGAIQFHQPHFRSCNLPPLAANRLGNPLWIRSHARRMAQGQATGRQDRLRAAHRRRDRPRQDGVAGGAFGRCRRSQGRRPRNRDRLLGRDRARAAHARPAARSAAAGGEPGGGGSRADRPCTRLSGDVPRARHDGGADPADPRRHRGAAAISQRPQHHRDAARPWCGAGRQRERHRGDHGNPLWRQ